MKSKPNIKNIVLAITFLASSINALIMLWRLIVEPFYTDQLTTLTWFGVAVLGFSILCAISCWEEFWRD